ncbi:alpha/beta fold hydrolase [Noviherbaspirillum saxi]|uniref:Alpha/beta hydrolase n=1 Tax=Noviherbaspirillum saxi TaxID=2320863 RepID=A0A3A3G0S9_9BURK|nr:alpha/beta hydrolase [Noviherbaspirillum saxi]RJF91673.1 alpha/beta hydrolase [Noviherbaspirillum saxi]
MSNGVSNTLASHGHESDVASQDSHPQWFRQALAKPGLSNFVQIDGVRIHYLSWNMEQTEKPALLFIHGFRAHAHWWDFIAPFFTEQYRVLAMDFSGMGDSEHRASYDVDTFANEIIGLIEALGLAPITAVGHSYGGSRLLRACAERPDLFRHAVVVDSYVLFQGEPGPSLPKKLLGTRTYPDYASARTRYRLMPEQPFAHDFLVAHIAHHAMRELEGGWRWKFDPDMPTTGYREPDGEAVLARIDTPVDYICGERSAVVDAKRALRTVQALRTVRGPIMIPDGQHHLMLDQPIALITTLRALLADTRQPNQSQSTQTPRKAQ